MFIKKQRMIELQNINLRLRAGGNVKKRNWYLILGMLLLVQLIAIFYFGSSFLRFPPSVPKSLKVRKLTVRTVYKAHSILRCR